MCCTHCTLSGCAPVSETYKRCFTVIKLIISLGSDHELPHLKFHELFIYKSTDEKLKHNKRYILCSITLCKIILHINKLDEI